MLIHQLLEVNEFKERCAYCGKDFVDTNKPELSRYGDKEYITLSCSNGHEHSFAVDMSRALDAKLLFKDIDHKKVPTDAKKHHASVSIADAVQNTH